MEYSRFNLLGYLHQLQNRGNRQTAARGRGGGGKINQKRSYLPAKT